MVATAGLELWFTPPPGRIVAFALAEVPFALRLVVTIVVEAVGAPVAEPS